MREAGGDGARERRGVGRAIERAMELAIAVEIERRQVEEVELAGQRRVTRGIDFKQRGVEWRGVQQLLPSAAR